MTEQRIPSKTFVLGEYSVLHGGPAILLASEPYFSLRLEEKNENKNPFHPLSPAGKLWELEPLLKTKSYLFSDPHHGLGGFGASSAEFIALFLQLNFLLVQRETNHGRKNRQPAPF